MNHGSYNKSICFTLEQCELFAEHLHVNLGASYINLVNHVCYFFRDIINGKHIIFRKDNDKLKCGKEIFIAEKIYCSTLTSIIKKIPIPFSDGDLLKNGAETESVQRSPDGIHVFKFIHSNMFNVEKYILHNILFGNKTPYKFIGFAHAEDGITFVISQPYIDLKPNSGDEARKLLTTDLENRYGNVFKANAEGDWFVYGINISLDDLKDTNIGIDSNNDCYAVVDCIIHIETSFDSWSEQEFIRRQLINN